MGAKSSSTGKIFGSVNTIQIAEVLTKSGFAVDRKNITLADDVKELGNYKATVKLHREVNRITSYNVCYTKLLRVCFYQCRWEHFWELNLF